jgi:hypothetical protein
VTGDGFEVLRFIEDRNIEWRETLIEDVLEAGWILVGQLADATQLSVSRNGGRCLLGFESTTHFSGFPPTGIAAAVVCCDPSYVCHV